MGKPATVVLRLLTIPWSHTSASVRPSRPAILLAMGRSVTAKPVASTIVSVGRSMPSVVTIDRGRTSAMPAVTSSALGAATAGK
ncbi:hypothetical protein [Blastococcus sp. SYSU DS0973]